MKNLNDAPSKHVKGELKRAKKCFHEATTVSCRADIAACSFFETALNNERHDCGATVLA